MISKKKRELSLEIISQRSIRVYFLVTTKTIVFMILVIFTEDSATKAFQGLPWYSVTKAFQGSFWDFARKTHQ
jgi:hypothetical protein